MKGKRIQLASALPPTVTIVPCVSSCPGDVYSRDSEEDINKFGLLPPCSGYMVRCIYPINLEIFMHEENFNLPIFNSEDFAQFVINENVKRDRVLKPPVKPWIKETNKLDLGHQCQTRLLKVCYVI